MQLVIKGLGYYIGLNRPLYCNFEFFRTVNLANLHVRVKPFMVVVQGSKHQM